MKKKSEPILAIEKLISKGNLQKAKQFACSDISKSESVRLLRIILNKEIKNGALRKAKETASLLNIVLDYQAAWQILKNAVMQHNFQAAKEAGEYLFAFKDTGTGWEPPY